MTLKPLIARLLPGLCEERLLSADPAHGGVNLFPIGGNPPTIGTKPMRTPPKNQDPLTSSTDGEAGTVNNAAHVGSH